MQPERITLQATLIVIGTGVLWGFYWVPVRAMTDMGLAGPWGTGAITLAAALLLAPVAFKNGAAFKEANLSSVGFIALGGAAFALYSIGFVYGRVALIILLFFLTPVWSTLIARYVMGWQTPRLRYYAIAVGIAGLTIMLSAQGNLPIPTQHRGMDGAGIWPAMGYCHNRHPKYGGIACATGRICLCHGRGFDDTHARPGLIAVAGS